MSTKSTIFLTSDNEHCFYDCSYPHFKDGMPHTIENHIGDSIFLEMDKSNIEIECNNEFDLIVEIKPGCDLYNYISQLQGAHETKTAKQKAQQIYDKITSYANYKEMNGIEREWILAKIEEGLREFSASYVRT